MKIPQPTHVPILALLRSATATFYASIHEHLETAEITDLPDDGAYVIGSMAHRRATPAQLLGELGLRGDRADEMTSLLVERGFLTTAEDSEGFALTERGRRAALAVSNAVVTLDYQVASLLSDAELIGFHRGLEILSTTHIPASVFDMG